MAPDGVIAPDDRRDPAQDWANDRPRARNRDQDQHDGPRCARVEHPKRTKQERQDRGGGAGFLAQVHAAPGVMRIRERPCASSRDFPKDLKSLS